MSGKKTSHQTQSQSQGVQQIIQTLYQVLADTYVLYLKTQNFHWNIIDSRFAALHLLFEKQYEELAEATDLIAEHIRTFCVAAPATMKQFLALTNLQEPEELITDGDSMLLLLYADHTQLAATLRSGVKLADKYGDAATSDLLVERLRAHDKIAWMLSSHFQSEHALNSVKI